MVLVAVHLPFVPYSVTNRLCLHYTNARGMVAIAGAPVVYLSGGVPTEAAAELAVRWTLSEEMRSAALVLCSSPREENHFGSSSSGEDARLVMRSFPGGVGKRIIFQSESVLTRLSSSFKSPCIFQQWSSPIRSLQRRTR